MKNTVKQAIIGAPCIAYFSGYGGIEIKDIVYGVNDAVVYVAGAWCSEKSAHKATVYYTAGDNCRAYFHYRGNRIYLDDCIRA